MVTIFSRALRLRTSRFITFLLVLSWGNLALAGEIHAAVKNNDGAKVRRLIKDSPDLVFSKDEDGFTPLHLAAADGYKEMAELLLANKADVNAKDNSESTPLHQAAGGQHADLLEVLIAHKANVNAADTNGLTPLHYATLADNGNAVKLLLIHGAHPDVRDKVDGTTPLIIAAGKGYKDVAEVLLANGLMSMQQIEWARLWRGRYTRGTLTLRTCFASTAVTNRQTQLLRTGHSAH